MSSIVTNFSSEFSGRPVTSFAEVPDRVLFFQDFDDVKVSTKTIIAMTNITIDLKRLYEHLPVVEYNATPKKRGRKRKTLVIENGISVPRGSIVTLKFENKIKGVDLKQKKTQKKKSKWFRNSFTVVIIIDDKPINFKICQNGMFQLTGIKFDHQAEECIKTIWGHISSYESVIYTYTRGRTFETLFIPAMRNIDFSVGFNIDREKLSTYMCSQTEFHSLLETSFGYTGVSIKLPISESIATMKIKKIVYDSTSNGWKETGTTYQEYLSNLPEREQIKKLAKERYSTFLIFQTGKIILSAINDEHSRRSYNIFLKIMQTCYKKIEEVLDV